ncbi:flagellar protein G [Halorubrum sp. F4]|uniref:flagellar protein G n=1 Tax=Halorubrum sp. F4 TaxID=2989715 RepID=UPI002480EA60|nr:flagellar protein G [Halorubrum sp. F4]
MASVPVSHLILFVASLVIAAGVVGTVTTGVDRVSAAVEDGSLDATQQLRTDVTVISDPNGGVYNGTENNVTLLVKNTGTQRLAPDGSGLDVVFDGRFVRPDATTGEVVSVDGATAWSRGDVLELTIDLDAVDDVGSLGDGETTDHRVYLTVNGDEETFRFRVEA